MADVSSEAEALYNQGQELLAAKKVEAACSALARSDALEPRGGTLLSLAYCHEQQGKLGLAHVEYDEALRRIRAGGGRVDREKFAMERLAGLRSQVVMVPLDLADGVRALNPEIVITPSRAGDVERKVPLVADRRQLLPFDANGGAYRVEVRAPKRTPFVAQVQITQAASPATLSVSDLPAAGEATGATPALVAPTPSAPDGSSQRTTGLVVGALGVPFLAVGAYFGIYKVVTCDCDELTQKDRYDTAKNVWANIGNVGIGVGVVAVAVGSYLYFTAPKGESRVGVAPLLAPQTAGASVVARF